MVFHVIGARIAFNDPRRFGMMKLVPRAAPTRSRCCALGPEPLGNEFDAGMLARACKGKKTSLKAALSDQKIVAGLGNIYVCEALHRARLSPKRRASTIATRAGLSNERAQALVDAIKAVLEAAIEAGGSSLRDHRRTDGELGDFQHNFRVYDREGSRAHAGLSRHHQAHGADRPLDVLLPGVSEIVELEHGHSFAGKVRASHCAITAAISLLFFSFIITWLLPLMPRAASRMKVGSAPACRRYFTVQWS